MLNDKVGTAVEIGGVAALRSEAGAHGHMIYGPYATLAAGRYVVTFTLQAGKEAEEFGNRLCAILDVTSAFGTLTHARQQVLASDLRPGLNVFPVYFDVLDSDQFEYRVYTFGEVALTALERRELLALTVPLPDRHVHSGLPDLRDGPLPTGFVANRDGYEALYERGADILIEGREIVASHAGKRIVVTDGNVAAAARQFWRNGLEIDVSYADAEEDVILLQALQDVSRKDGFYVDVGANDPEIISVTKLFYDRGWRGINVEPSPKWFPRLAEARPRDINIQAAVSDSPGDITFYDHPDGGLGTMEPDIAARHRDEFGATTNPVIVRTMSLSDIFAQYAPRDVHFLKVDVEGHEAAVLRSLDFARYRPWILCIEATEPMHVDVKTFQHWDPMLVSAGYTLVRSDFLNRYYVARERDHLRDRFRNQPRGYVKA